MKAFLLISILIFYASTLPAQKKSSKNKIAVPVPDTTKTIQATESPIKSLSTAEYDAYQNADPMGLTTIAEINNYPSPSSVLALAGQLRLSVVQKSQISAVQEALRFKAKEMGRFIIQNEKKFNDLFATGKVNDGTLIYYTNQYGLYQGELRNAHLQAHLKVRRILTPDQLKKITQLK